MSHARFMKLFSAPAGYAVIGLMTVSACTSVGSSDSPGSGASCAFTIDFQGRTYVNEALLDRPLGKRLATTTYEPCDDTGGNSQVAEVESEEVTIYQIDGLSSDLAIGVILPDGQSAIFALDQPGSSIPGPVQDFIDSM